MEVFNANPIDSIQEIRGLHISDITIPRCTDALRSHGITHVLSLTNKKDCPTIGEELGIQHLHVEIEDNPLDDILMSLEGLCAWIKHALDSYSSDKQHPTVLVHCIQGISRSGTVIVAYIMQALSLDFDTALALAQKSRPIILPNSGFVDQLRLWKQMNYSIYNKLSEKGGEDKRDMKPDYEEWKANRGVLLSRPEQEKQKIVMKSMADMAAKFGARRLEARIENA